MPKLKISLFIILGLIIIIFCFLSYIYFHQNYLFLNKNQFLGSNWILSSGYGVVKNINNSYITLEGFKDKTKTITLKINQWTKFNQVIGEENGVIKTEPINLTDLKIGDQVFYSATLSKKDGIFYLTLINVKKKND